MGANDNAWTLLLTNALRFHFANDADIRHLWIVDSTAPYKGRCWMVDRSVQMATNNYCDHAFVAQFTDPITGKPTPIAGGLRAAAPLRPANS